MKTLILSIAALTVATTPALAGWSSGDKETPDETLTFTATSGEDLRGYLWYPDNYDPQSTYKAVVMAHGCGGAHYTNDAELWIASKVAGKFKVWGNLLSQQDLMVLLVDSFTTRDVDEDIGGGVCSISYSTRPTKIDPIDVRPMDIASGIAYLNGRDDVSEGQIGVLGFSNGGTSALALSSHGVLNPFNVPFTAQYKAARIVALYPGCGMQGYHQGSEDLYDNVYEAYTDTYLYAASDDGSFSPGYLDMCQALEDLDPDLWYSVVGNTDHQFDYYENGEANVDATMTLIIQGFVDMP